MAVARSLVDMATRVAVDEVAEMATTAERVVVRAARRVVCAVGKAETRVVLEVGRAATMVVWMVVHRVVRVVCTAGMVAREAEVMAPGSR